MSLRVASGVLDDARARLESGAITAEALAKDALAAIDSLNPELNAFVAMNPERTLAMARDSDARRQQGKARPLEGLPIAVKDSFCVVGATATAASKILEGFVPPYESGVTERLWQAGAVFLGKTNCDEFSMGSSNEHSAYGATTNPWRRNTDPDTALTPGGSSGGSAAAVAAGLAWMGLGGDTGGSIRQPASFCGLVGIKPTYGLCSRFGLIAFASSLDQAGPLAASVEDAARALEVMVGHDPRDATSRPRKDATGDYLKAATNPSVEGRKIGVARNMLADPNLAQAIEDAAQALKTQGATLVAVDAPDPRLALAAYYVLAPAEASSNLARYDGIRYGRRAQTGTDDINAFYAQARGEGFGKEAKRRILIGTHVLSAGYYDAYYLRAQKARTKIAMAWQAAFAQCDAVLAPTTPSSAFALGEVSDPVAMYQTDAFTVASSLAGLPSLSLPWRLDPQGLPVGVQIIAPAYKDAQAFQVAAALERAADPAARAPASYQGSNND